MIVLALVIPENSLRMSIEFERKAAPTAHFLGWDLPVLLHGCGARRFVLGWPAARPFTRALQDTPLPPDRRIGMADMAYN